MLVDFWAAWCGPCLAFAPIYGAAAEDNTDITFAKVDTERLPQLAARYRVQGIPNFVVFRDGAVAQQRAGAMKSSDLMRLLDVAPAV